MSAALDIHRPSEVAASPTDTVTTVEAMTPMQMAYRLLESGIDLGSVKEMLTVSKELAADQARMEFSSAIASAKAEIKPVIKNRDGHNARYADFAAIANAVDPIISQYGLSYRFKTTQTDRINVTCILEHVKGHFEEITLSGPADKSGSKNEIQALGSTLTYLQRYTLIQALGLAVSQDTDGANTGAKIEDLSPINAEQRSELLSLISSTNTDIEIFCRFYKIDAVPDLPVSKFEAAKKKLTLTKVSRANG